jgi:4-amino-4-deoxy-L-arabinose transferase-like glycosyltransferase
MNLRAFLSKPGNAFGLLTVFYIGFMFLPRVVPQGMFVDGLLYSSISRNLAEGRGSWWLPFFSNGYWIKTIAHDHYFENPPLLFWMQSVFFRVLGDYWWVEKLYATLLLLLNCFLIIRIWKTVLKNISGETTMSWLPVLFFYLIPIVFWGSAYNLMDSQLLTFCLLAVWALLTGVIEPQGWRLYYSLAVVCIFGGILVKGPVAIYPVAFPFFYFLVFDPTKWRTGIAHSLILLTSVVALFALLLWIHAPALLFFTQYWDQRLGAAIMGGRDEGVRIGSGRLYVLWLLLRENSILIGVSAMLLLVSYLKGIRIAPSTLEKKWSLVFFLLAVGGTLPLMLSTRQAAMYLIPSLVMFAIAAAIYHYRLISYLLARIPVAATRGLAVVMILGIAFVAVFSSLRFGKPSRDIAMLEDIQEIKSIIPKESLVGVSDKLMRNSGAHVYLQRYLKVELTEELDDVKYVLLDQSRDSEADLMLESGAFEPVFKGKKLSLYVH